MEIQSRKQDIPKDVLDRYNERLHNILNAITKFKAPNGINSFWQDRLSRRTCEQWVNDINEVTTDSFKILLGKDIPPSQEELLSLENTLPTEPGVYLSVIRAESEGHGWYIYIGSATKPREGLRGRISEHQRKSYSKDQWYVKPISLNGICIKTNLPQSEGVISPRTP